MSGKKGALTALLTPEISLFYQSTVGYHFMCLHWADGRSNPLIPMLRLSLMEIIGKIGMGADTVLRFAET
jgi:hypothetical protein